MEKRHIRQTSQKNAIIKVIEEAKGPISPTEILEQATKITPTLGIATVYRNLKRFQDEGLIKAVQFVTNDTRYEPSDRGHHHHFLCDHCGRAYDIFGCPDGLNNLVPKGFEIEGHDVTLYGKCPGCKS